MMPPIAGPIERMALNAMELSVTAEGRSLRGTISPSEACHDGLKKVDPVPIRKVSTSSSQGVSISSQASAQSSEAEAIMKSCAPIITRRRSKLSASVPAKTAKSMVGTVTPACTSATMASLSEICVIIQPAPTDCTSVPRFEAMEAVQRARKAGMRRTVRGDADLVGIWLGGWSPARGSDGSGRACSQGRAGFRCVAKGAAEK